MSDCEQDCGDYSACGADNNTGNDVCACSSSSDSDGEAYPVKQGSISALKAKIPKDKRKKKKAPKRK